MGKTTIEWTEHSYNPVTGCSHAGSPGCDHCYARRMARRLAGRYGYPEAPNHFDVTLRHDRLEQPLHWKKPRMIFVCSMSDFFHEDVPDDFITSVLGIMSVTQHTFLILTKRPENFLSYLERTEGIENLWPLENVWLGVSVENQATADERIPLLLQTPAAVRFVSLEPLLEAVNLEAFLPYEAVDYAYGFKYVDAEFSRDGLDWVIVGGESGSGARPMKPQWARDVRDQCQAAGVPYFHKQNGAWTDNPETIASRWSGIGAPPESVKMVEGTWMAQVGKKRAGRLLDGQLWEEYPR